MSKGNKLALAGVLGALAVILGAFGAHTLKNKIPGGLISPDQLNGFDTAVKYHMYHTLAMILVLVMQAGKPSRLFSSAYYFFLCGIILFSGSLYLLCTRHLLQADFLSILGPVTPLGGLCFVIGWILLALGSYKDKGEK
jgi:uncharacterized membrane protein YgdD (TMEM256/DUF423 family)